MYVWLFLVELWHLIGAAFGNQADLQALVNNIGYTPDKPLTGLNETIIMLVVLALIDVVMISNLLIMVIVGGYETFVSRLGLDSHPDQPEWLDHVNASVLKVKLATVDHRHQLHPPAQDLHQRGQLRHQGADVANHHPRGLLAQCPGYCLHR